MFDQAKGLVNYITSLHVNKQFKDCVKKAIEIIYTIINNFPYKVVEANVVDIYTMCIKIMKSSITDANIRGKIITLATITLEKVNDFLGSTKVTEALKELLTVLMLCLNQRHTSSTVIHGQLVTLGLFCKKYSFLVEDPTKIKRIFWRYFETELSQPQKTSFNILSGCFMGFLDYCASFPLDLEKKEDKNIAEKLFKAIKGCISTKDKIKVGSRAAIIFFANNTPLFQEYLCKDYKVLHEGILMWLYYPGLEDKKAGSSGLKALHHTLAVTVESQDSNECCKEISTYFNEWAKAALNKEKVSNFEKRLAICALKAFSETSYKHLDGNYVAALFVYLLQNFERTYIFNSNIESDEWEFLPDYIQIFANVTRFRSFSSREFVCLQRASINMLKSFHHLPYQHHALVVEAVCTTLLFLKSGKYFEMYLENIVYQGVVWSCSHQHISMEAFAQETTEKIITCKNYFPLWRGILKIKEISSYAGLGFSLEDKKYVEERVVTELVKTLMILINKLNIKMHIREDYGGNSSLENVYSVEHVNDYTIFLNVVDFYQEIFEISRPHLFRKCISRMAGDLIKKCIQYPLVSGFYRLLSFALKIGNKLNISTPDYVNSLGQFLPTLLNKITQFKDELSIACLQVLLAIPISIVQDMLVACADAFKTIFDIGKSYLPLAELGLTTLEHWQDNIDPAVLQPLLVEVVPSLDSFLRSKSVEESVQTMTTKRRKTAQALKKRRVVVVLEPELIKLQKKLLCFIGRQNLEVSRALVFSDNIYTTSQISGVNTHLEITLPYEDVQLDIIYDKFASRITDLALHCSDRKIRVMACEFLHALIVILLGKAKSLPEKSLPDLNAILKLFVSSALQLSCDVDQIVQQMFAPLCSQLVHWYTSRTQIRSAHSAVVIECLMDGVTHSSNAALRDTCGKYISEFVEWSIRQSNDSINMKVLVKKMRFFSSHPHPAKKLGAALIFNNIYKEIVREESLIKMFWVELLHIFVTSIATCEDFDETNTVIQTKKALQNLLKVFLRNPDVFKDAAKHRILPREVGNGTLPEIATWLFKETSCKNIHCRDICMSLYTSIAPLTGDDKAHVKALVDSLNGDLCNLYEDRFISFSEINEFEDSTSLIKWMKQFLCTLDGYNFIIKNGLGIICMENKLFKELQYYMKNLQTVDISKALNLIAGKNWTYTAIEKENFNRLKGNCTIAMLRLFKEIMNDDSLYQQSGYLWNEFFLNFVKNNIFCPHLLGINQVNQETHRTEIILLLNQMSSRIDETVKLVDTLTPFIRENCDIAIDMKENVSLKKRNLIKGLILLNETTMCMKGFIKTELLIPDIIGKVMTNISAEAKNGIIF
nr:unnamed protein product [Callosobruchus chinensis]